MAEREDGSESPERSQQNVVLKMSMKGMSIDSIADVLTLEPCDVVRILEEAKSHPSQDGGNKATKEMVKRLMTDPPELCCPVSKELMEDPVVAGDGFTYERSYIEGCLKSKKLSPMTGKNIETQVLNPNQHLKTTIYSFKESTVMGILNVAPQLPVDLLLQALPRAERFVREQLPDAFARKKLSSLLLFKMKLPGVNPRDLAKEVISLVQTSDASQLQQFLCDTAEPELRSLLPNLEEALISTLYKTMQTSTAACKRMIDQEFVSRMGRRAIKEDEALKKLWKLLSANSEDNWKKAAAVVLAAFLSRLKLSLEEVDLQMLQDACGFLENQAGAIHFAKEFFRSDLGMSTGRWPPEGSAKIFSELLRRDTNGTNGEGLELLRRAHSLDEKDTEIRKLLKTRLQHRMQLWDELNDGATEEALFLKLLCEDKEEIPAELLAKLSLQNGRLKELSPQHLLSLSQKLGEERRAEAAQMAIDAAKLFAKDGKDGDSYDAFLTAFRLDRNNDDAANGLVTTVEGLKKCVDELKKNLGMSFVWELAKYDFTSIPKGQKQESDKFQIFPGINAWLQIYPKGNAKSPPGRAAAFLCVDKPAKVKVKFQWGKVQRISDLDHSDNLGKGWRDIVSTTEVNRDITLQVLSVQPASSCVRMVAPGM